MRDRRCLAVVVCGVLSVAGFPAVHVEAQEASKPMTSQDVVPNEMLVTFGPAVSEADATATIRSAGVEMIGPPMVGGRVFHVRVLDPSKFSQIAETLRNAPGVLATEAVQVVRVPPMPKR